jgi:DNA invertase Pin-like site-specific DNA recombinase
MFVRAYLRASTVEQDVMRAKGPLSAFAIKNSLKIASWYYENESGASLKRPELFRLIADSAPGDVLLIEQVDRLSRLTAVDWDKLKAEITARRIRVVALDLPTSWAMVKPDADQFTTRMFEAIDAMMLDMLAAVARKDYEDRRRRQQEGVRKAQASGKYRGRPVDADRHAAIAKMLAAGLTWSAVQDATGCSRSTIARIAKSQ